MVFTYNSSNTLTLRELVPVFLSNTWSMWMGEDEKHTRTQIYSLIFSHQKASRTKWRIFAVTQCCNTPIVCHLITSLMQYRPLLLDMWTASNIYCSFITFLFGSFHSTFVLVYFLGQNQYCMRTVHFLNLNYLLIPMNAHFVHITVLE